MEHADQSVLLMDYIKIRIFYLMNHAEHVRQVFLHHLVRAGHGRWLALPSEPSGYF
jgi:hypothetical protein